MTIEGVLEELLGENFSQVSAFNLDFTQRNQEDENGISRRLVCP